MYLSLKCLDYIKFISMKVKFTNLYKLIHDKKKILIKIGELIKNSKFVGGYEVENFEKAFAKDNMGISCSIFLNLFEGS